MMRTREWACVYVRCLWRKEWQRLKRQTPHKPEIPSNFVTFVAANILLQVTLHHIRLSVRPDQLCGYDAPWKALRSGLLSQSNTFILKCHWATVSKRALHVFHFKPSILLWAQSTPFRPLDNFIFFFSLRNNRSGNQLWEHFAFRASYTSPGCQKRNILSPCGLPKLPSSVLKTTFHFFPNNTALVPGQHHNCVAKWLRRRISSWNGVEITPTNTSSVPIQQWWQNSRIFSRV